MLRSALILALALVTAVPASAGVITALYDGNPFANRRGVVVNPADRLSAGFRFDDAALDADGDGVVGTRRNPVVDMWASDNVLFYDHGSVRLWIEGYEIVAWKFNLRDASNTYRAISVKRGRREFDRFQYNRLNRRGQYRRRTLRHDAGTWQMLDNLAEATEVSEPHPVGLLVLGLGLTAFASRKMLPSR